MSQFSKQRLHEVYVKSCSHEGLLNIYIYRPISLRIAVLAAALHRTPNQVTMASLFLSLASAAMFMTGNYTWMLWGLVPFHLGKILDCADGQLASLTNQRSKLGGFLDPFCDRIVDIVILTSLAIAYQVHTGSYIGLWMMLVFVSAWFISSYLENQSNGEQQALGVLRETTASRAGWVKKLLKWDGGFNGLITTIAVVFWQEPVILAMYVAVALLPVPIQFLRIYKELRAA